MSPYKKNLFNTDKQDLKILADDVKNLKKRVRKIKPEIKRRHTSTGNVSVTANTWSYVHLLSSITQGTDSSTRLGQEIMLLKVEYMIYFDNNDTYTDAASYSKLNRFIVFVEKDTSTTLVAADLFLDTPGIASIWAPVNRSNFIKKKEFHWVSQRLVANASADMLGASADCHYFRLLTVPINKKVTYEIGSNTVLTNDVFLTVCFEGGSDSVTAPFRVDCIFHYYDM